jgi:hypothetical protein
LGIEIMLSAPVNDQWQSLTVRLVPVLDPDAMRVWDHRTGAPPDQALNSRCEVAIPAETSDSNRGGVVWAGLSPLTYDFPQHVFDGSWCRAARMRLLMHPLPARTPRSVTSDPKHRGTGATIAEEAVS